MEQDTFTVINEDGREITCEILFAFDSSDTGKSYVFYTDYSRDASGDIRVFASIYDPTRENPRLEPIETEQEWNVIGTILSTLNDQIRSGISCGD